MKGIRYRLAAATMRHRVFSAGLLLGITAFFAYGLQFVELKTIFSDLFPKTHPFVETYVDHPNFGNPLTVTMMLKRTDGGDIYNEETIAKVKRLTREIDLTPAVDHDQILSITTEKARYAEATPFGVDLRPLMDDEPPSTPEALEEFKSRVDKAPNVRTFLISTDETATIISATFIERSLDYGVVFKFVQDLAEKNATKTTKFTSPASRF